jgi:AcrR family transcriptional regulator
MRMARPRSEDKRNAILEAAVTEFAARGAWATPTAAISKAAGIADGTLFTYFATKDLLLNELYRALKQELAEAMFSGCPRAADARQRVRHLWDSYIHWGIDNPDKLKVMMQLTVSAQITPESRATGYAPLMEMEHLAQDCIKRKLIRDLPVEYIGAMFGSLAETTMKFVAQQGGRRRVDFYAAGFETFWNGIAAR